MKAFKIIILSTVLALVATPIFAQGVGELDRFSNELLDSKNEVKLFPNPSVEYLNVTIANSDLENVTFTVHNIIGNVVEVEVEEVGENDFKVNVKDLPTGYYLLAIKDEKKHFRETYKFLKK
ncbi:MAG: T9SS type A sorting domain-containing protein [Fulvivirga sp.]